MSKKMNVKQIERLMMLGLGIIALFFLLRQCLATENNTEGMMQPIVSEQAQPTTTIETPATTPVTIPTCPCLPPESG